MVWKSLKLSPHEKHYCNIIDKHSFYPNRHIKVAYGRSYT